MVQRVREPFGKAGLIVAVVALVAALAGGAYAAAGLTGKQKKEVKKIAKKFAGQDGAPGAAGQPGAKGDTGAAGSNGTNGTNGTNGESVTGLAASSAECGGVAGGVKYTLKGVTTKICNGKEGSAGESVTIVPLDPGDSICTNGGSKFVNASGEGRACNGLNGTGGDFPDTLPAGHTVSGFWEVQGEKGVLVGEGVQFAVSTISFPLPLTSAPEVLLFNAAAPTEEEEEKCPGSAFEPKAKKGVLCLYLRSPAPVTLLLPGGETIGAFLGFAKTDEGFGTWAVTAPDPAP